MVAGVLFGSGWMLWQTKWKRDNCNEKNNPVNRRKFSLKYWA